MEILKILPRIYVKDLDSALEFYEELLVTSAVMRFEIPESELGIALVGEILLVAGSDQTLKPFRNTQATMLVDTLDEFQDYLEEKGAEILRGPNTVPTGRNMTVRHPDGAIIEYVEHSKTLENE